MDPGELELTQTGFRFLAGANNNYGPDYGIYIAQGQQDQMYTNGLRFCRTGVDSGAVDDIMNPDTNNLIEFDCT